MFVALEARAPDFPKKTEERIEPESGSLFARSQVLSFLKQYLEFTVFRLLTVAQPPKLYLNLHLIQSGFSERVRFIL